MIKHISPSMISQFTRCGEQFRRRRIEGEIIPPGIAARIGTGFHRGAEVNHRAKIITGKDEPLSVVQDAARDGYVAALQGGVYFAPDEVAGARKAMAEGVDTTVALARKYHASLAPQIQPVMVEKQLWLDVGELPLPITGIVDVVSVDGWWADLKTAGQKWPQARADSDIAATVYAEMLGYPKRMTFEVLTTTKEVAHHSLITTRTPEDFEAFVRRVQVILGMVERGIFPPADPTGWFCSPKWCGFWWTCKFIPEHKKVLPTGGQK